MDGSTTPTGGVNSRYVAVTVLPLPCIHRTTAAGGLSTPKCRTAVRNLRDCHNFPCPRRGPLSRPGPWPARLGLDRCPRSGTHPGRLSTALCLRGHWKGQEPQRAGARNAAPRGPRSGPRAPARGGAARQPSPSTSREPGRARRSGPQPAGSPRQSPGRPPGSPGRREGDQRGQGRSAARSGPEERGGRAQARRSGPRRGDGEPEAATARARPRTATREGQRARPRGGAPQRRKRGGR